MRPATQYVFLIAIAVYIILFSLELLCCFDKSSICLREKYTFVGALNKVSQFQHTLNATLSGHFEHNATSEPFSEPRETVVNRKLTKVWKEYQNNFNLITGNPLIDDYGKNDLTKIGELGRGVTFVGEEKRIAERLTKQYHINVYASDLIPLNRIVPDSRFENCSKIQYPEDLPSVSVIIPFCDEWPSILLRTVYSVVNRTPRHLLEEIILVDDGSTMDKLKRDLDDYIKSYFPEGLIKLLRFPQRFGLIKARMEGWKISTGKVVIFFDSHMEVNVDWLQPLLMEIKKDRKTVAMGVLDYIQLDSFEYRYREGHMIKYGFDWRLLFFEILFRNDEIGRTPEDVRPGTVMVGAAYAINSNYFREIGAYDVGMKVWGGENLEMTWRITLCGGRLIHIPCSHIGHIARSQPYSFPGGRHEIEVYNYKRAIEVWMEPEYQTFVYDYFPEMKDFDVGDLSERLEIKKRLQCKPFSYYLTYHWPDLLVYNQNVSAWGSVRNLLTNKCLDNHQQLYPQALYVDPCHYKLATQGFSWMKNKQLRTTLLCVAVKNEGRPMLEYCTTGPMNTWEHKKGGYLKHEKSGLCLDLDHSGPILKTCSQDVVSQLWEFNHYLID